MLSKLLLYFVTIYYLKPIQIFARLKNFFYNPKADNSTRPSLRKIPCVQTFLLNEKNLLNDRGEFLFLNQSGLLKNIGWYGNERTKLWRYNQHYFEYLNSTNRDITNRFNKKILLDWVKSNPPAFEVGWEPYPTSLRVVNWIKYHLSFDTLPEECLQSLAVQGRWLYTRLEFHILGNHLLANAKALIFLGLFFRGKEADKWLRKGIKIMSYQVSEQILSDGGHFERSAMYHSIILEDLIDIYSLCSTNNPPKIEKILSLLEICEEKIPMMCEWLNVMTHPDEEIAFFNDAAFRIAPKPRSLLNYAARYGFNTPEIKDNCIWLRESGYLRAQHENVTLIVDIARLGPDYQLGHAHADTLSFELSIFGRRLVVNSGTSDYNIGSTRQHQRSTRAHNTVEINDRNSSEMWASFRVARRASPFDIKVKKGKKKIVIEGSHNGYSGYFSKIIHCRRWVLTGNSLRVIDNIDGNFKKWVSRLYLHPHVKCKQKIKCKELKSLNDIIYFNCSLDEVNIRESKWAPEFGNQIPNQFIEMKGKGATCGFTMRW